MPDHLHAILTPLTSLEKAVQFIKGGSSYRAKKELGSNLGVWQKGFSDHRIRDASDYRLHTIYVHHNPLRKHLCERVEDYPFSSASGRYDSDPAPQGLKPQSILDPDGAAEAASFQSQKRPVVAVSTSDVQSDVKRKNSLPRTSRTLAANDRRPRTND